MVVFQIYLFQGNSINVERRLYDCRFKCCRNKDGIYANAFYPSTSCIVKFPYLSTTLGLLQVRRGKGTQAPLTLSHLAQQNMPVEINTKH